jgi:hypothetical protein
MPDDSPGGLHDDEPRILRPDPVVLDQAALVPSGNRIDLLPTRFSHTTMADIPFSYALSEVTRLDDGELARGSKVVVLRTEGDRTWVLDASGVVVQVATEGLTVLPSA